MRPMNPQKPMLWYSLLIPFLVTLRVSSMERYNFIDLTHTVHQDIPTWDLTCGYYIKTMRDYRHCEGDSKFRSQTLDIRASAGTHIDSPAHCFEGGRDVADLDIKELVCPCVVIDVSQKADERYKVSIDDIHDFEAATVL